MSFDINTNVTSLQAQNYLRINSAFQGKTINEVTSGLRIVNSGDDAAGLAIANGDRSTEAVLTQGIRNANDGLSQLQTADGGLNNISQLLDRARTLATQSSSATFTGDRGVLNNEFQSVIGEIDRQAQAIGLNQGGTFAQSLSVFVGGGKGTSNAAVVADGTVNVNLSQSTVDSKSLGLRGVQASGAAGTDIGTGSSTSVQNILQNNTNTATETQSGYTTFTFTGPGFSNTSGAGQIQLSVNLSGVTDSSTLVTAINSAIQAAGNGGSQQATAFKNANITASLNTDALGKQQLTFNSASSAFEVQGGDQVATALLGSFSSGSTGNSALVTATAGAAFVAPAGATTVKMRILGAGLNGAATDLSVTFGAADTAATVAATINTQIAGNAAYAATGIQAVANGGKIDFVGKAGQSFEVQTAGDVNNNLGYGNYAGATGEAGGGNFNYTTLTATSAGTAAKTQGIAISINGGATVDLGVLTSGATELANLTTLNNAIQGSSALRAAGIVAVDSGGNINIKSTGGSTNFRLQFYNGGVNNADAFGFGAATTAATSATAATTTSAYAAKDSTDSSGAFMSVNNAPGNQDVYQFTGLRNAGDAQTVSVSANDSNGAAHSINLNLTTANANNLDQAVASINSLLQQSNDSTLQNIVAVKEQGSSNLVNGVEGIRFMSASVDFKVSLGQAPASSTAGQFVGISDGGTGLQNNQPITAQTIGTGGTADISNLNSAQAAVTALGNSVTILGSSQAVVGRGENLFNYAVNLAQSQLTNTTAAEAQIRDADLAAESANLTKAQILVQAGVAALSQANSAPQQVLALLQGH